ncbi:MAG: hypothetical protein FD135_2005 [Comamonadaceae bacterium]|nr:MAG: hypothetical protein FD135_2005 [Comamonadaceae bacterium]
MLQFKFLLWALAQMLQRKIKHNPDCAQYVKGKRLVFQIRTASGSGRHYVIENGAIRSFKDAQAAFIRGVGSKDLTISGDFREVMWFQGLTAFLQPPKIISPYDRTTF